MGIQQLIMSIIATVLGVLFAGWLEGADLFGLMPDVVEPAPTVMVTPD